MLAGELVAGVATAAVVATGALGTGDTLVVELVLETLVLGVEVSGVGVLAGGVAAGVSVAVAWPVALREVADLPALSPRPPFWRWLASWRDSVGSASRGAADSCCSAACPSPVVDVAWLLAPECPVAGFACPACPGV